MNAALLKLINRYPTTLAEDYMPSPVFPLHPEHSDSPIDEESLLSFNIPFPTAPMEVIEESESSSAVTAQEIPLEQISPVSIPDSTTTRSTHSQQRLLEALTTWLQDNGAAQDVLSEVKRIVRGMSTSDIKHFLSTIQ
eukprot:gnl/Dysnectes_brevis/3623_a4615_1438.p1 GENE.gnl/Dysnectes_brevis/3623_a4615_1438~~gnl/Dysnectes_brevis/3623_a4615_1438.p1  ORF type:complete len:138 (+),score=16.03 gnl/Dysnectes_brevis/3623_a4615_1438:2-415(+)